VGWLKAKVPRTGWFCVCVCALVSASGPARAQSGDPLLVLQEPAHPQTGLFAALRIQLMHATPVRLRDWQPAGTLGERIAAATALGNREHALAVVWTEQAQRLANGGLEAVLYVVLRSQTRALLEVVRVPGGHGADLTRTLALKVEEIIEELRRSDQQLDASVLRAGPQPTAASGQAVPTAAGEPPPAAGEPPPPAGEPTAGKPPPPTAASVANSTRSGLMLGTGARLSSFGWARWGLGIGAGPTLESDAWRAGLRLGLDWYPDATRWRAGARVTLGELTPLLLTAAQWRHEGFGLGAHVGLGVALLHARGETARGRSGSANAQTVAALLGVVIEQTLVQGLGIAASLDLQVRGLHQQFDVNGTTLVELQRSGLVAALELVWSAP
jgi:hypothetical protein